MKKIAAVMLAASAAVLGIAVHTHQAGASTHPTVHVTLRDYRVVVSQRDLPAGRPITFIVTNHGHQTHEFVLEPKNAFDQALRFHGQTYEADEIKPGTTRTVTWIIPRQGAYKLACHIDHHYQKGMKAMIMAVHAST